MSIVADCVAGLIHILPKFGVLSISKIDGKVRLKDGEYTVTIDYDCTLTPLGWVCFTVGLFTILGWLLVFVFPYLKKSAIETMLRRKLRDLE